MNKTGLVYHEKYAMLHETANHPECKERLLAIRQKLVDLNLWSKLNHITPKPVDINLLSFVHNEEYLQKILSFCQSGGGNWDPDTVVSPCSFELALLSAGGAISAIDAVSEKKVDNCFVMSRPPGHHAESNSGMGFCLLNNAAIAARYAQRELGLKKVFIVDFDAHHGNGIEEIFYNDPSVLYFSIHETHLYPNTGFVKNSGVNQGLGYNINVQVPRGTGNEAYYYIFNRLMLPVIRQYKPQLIIACAGFDGYYHDPLTGLELTCAGFEQLTELLLSISEEICENRCVFLLEGGYSGENVGKPVAATISKMLGHPLTDKFYVDDCICNEFFLTQRIYIDGAIAWHRRFWNL